MTCPYFGRPQPSNMRSYNDRPLCLACATRLVPVGTTLRHEDDPRAIDTSEVPDGRS